MWCEMKFSQDAALQIAAERFYFKQKFELSCSSSLLKKIPCGVPVPYICELVNSYNFATV